MSENMFERTVFKATRIDHEKKSGRRDKSKRLLVPLQTRDGQTQNESTTTLFLINLKCQRKLAQFNELHQTGNENKI